MSRTFIVVLLFIFWGGAAHADAGRGVDRALAGVQGGTCLAPSQSRSWVDASMTSEQIAACCRICRKGKACGNSCISRAKT